MEIIPAIDIRGGVVVRLYQGDFSKETVYANDPVAVAQHWAEMGAPRLHLVDLDGARQGRPVNTRTIVAIAKAVKVPIQVGGGLRDIESVNRLLEDGIHRVVLGTAALENAMLMSEICRRYGEAIVVGIDAREGRVATQGWQGNSSVSVTEMARSMVDVGVSRFIYTDISRDGTLEGPNLGPLREFLAITNLPVIAAGGVSGLDDLQVLSTLGLEGVVVGKALYTGAVNLRETLASLSP